MLITEEKNQRKEEERIEGKSLTKCMFLGDISCAQNEHSRHLVIGQAIANIFRTVIKWTQALILDSAIYILTNRQRKQKQK